MIARRAISRLFFGAAVVASGARLVRSKQNPVLNRGRAKPPRIKRFKPESPEVAVVRDALEESSVSPILADLGEVFGHNTRLILMGGFLRDAFIAANGTPPEPHDIDFIVDIDPRTLSQTVDRTSWEISRTYFGGYRWHRAGSVTVDFWALSSNHNVRIHGLRPSLANALYACPFNVDRIAYDVNARTLHDGGCLAGISAKTLIFDGRRPYLLHVQAARAALLMTKLQLRPHSSVLDLIRASAWESHRDEVIDYLANNGYDTVVRRASLELLESLSPGKIATSLAA
jgi:hypothetical protein